MSRLAFLVLCVSALARGQSRAPGAVEISPTPQSKDNAELAQLLAADQAPRKKIDSLSAEQMTELEKADATRLTRAVQLYQANQLTTAADYYAAAMILQHGKTPEDYLLAHDLAVVASLLGEKHAPWLAAASEDRFLRSIGRAQRFGTQFWRDLKSSRNAPWSVAPMEDGVTDAVRKIMRVPSLAESKSREKQMNGGK